PDRAIPRRGPRPGARFRAARRRRGSRRGGAACRRGGGDPAGDPRTPRPPRDRRRGGRGGDSSDREDGSMSKTTSLETTFEQRIGPRGRFSLRQASGDVQIRGIEGDTVRVKSIDDRRLSDVFDIEVGDDRVELRQRDGLDAGMRLLRRGSGGDLRIEVPHGAAVAIDTGSADIEATDLSGAKRFRTASGEVSLN